MPQPPNFRQRRFLCEHAASILAFYTNRARDPNGGFYQNYLDDGSVFLPKNKHLVSSARMVWMFCKAETRLSATSLRTLWVHGLDFLQHVHWQSARQGYIWTFDETGSVDETNYSYGLAFVLLAYAAALEAGERRVKDDLEETFEILEDRFWCPSTGVYVDECAADWSACSPYRGQNSNMHMCEALIACFDSTLNDRYLERAVALARVIAVQQANKTDGLIWEHFDEYLDVDWDYNRDDPENLYKPWGFQPGHQVEWAKLLVRLHERTSESWMVQRARDLFDRSVNMAWDSSNGGLYFSHAPNGLPCDRNKYFWVQAEAIAAAAVLADKTGDPGYWEWYDRLWQYCWKHFVDHKHGAWYRLLTPENIPVSNRKSEAGAKCDYHTFGACLDVLEVAS